MVKVFKDGKVKVVRDDVSVHVNGAIGTGYPVLRIHVSDKITKDSYYTHHTPLQGEEELVDNVEYKTKLAEQFLDRAISQRK